MRQILLATALALAPTSAFACINSGNSTETYVEICPTINNCGRVNYADLSNKNLKSKAAQDEVEQLLQDFLDFRQLKTDPRLEDDPDKFTDPARPGLFWSDAAGKADVALAQKTYLTSRAAVVTAQWDGAVFQLSWSCT